MAIINGDGKAGQYAKRTAYEQTKRMIQSSMIAMFIGGIVIGFILAANFLWRITAFRWLASHVWVFVAIEGCISIAVILWLRRSDVYMNQLMKERIKWLRGGQGEALVAWYLNDLPSTWHVFHNVQLWKNGDLDHVLIGPAGLFCISTKANRGLYTIEPDGKYFLNGQETNHLYEAQRLALKLKDRLEGIAGAAPWIQPVLIAPFAYINFQTYQNTAWVLHEGNLNDVFTDAQQKLKPTDIERYAKAVKMITDNSQTI